MSRVSECCGVKALGEIVNDFGICSDCREHAQFSKEEAARKGSPRSILKSERPIVTLAKPGSECVMVLTDDKRAIAAILIPEQIHIGQIEYCYALGQGRFIEAVKLASMWNCWAVLCLPGWGTRQVQSRAARPAGAKFFFAS